MVRVLFIVPISQQVLLFRQKLIEQTRRRGHELAVCTAEIGPRVERWLAEHEIALYPVELGRRGLNPVADIRYLRAVRRAIRAYQPSHVFSFTIKPVIYGTLAARAEGTPHIFSVIEGAGSAFGATGLVGKGVRSAVERLYRRALPSNEKVFVLNDDDRSLFEQKGLVKPDQVVKIDGIGLDLSHYEYSTPPIEPIRFLLIARLIREKGVEIFVAAARQLRSEGYDFRCSLLGDFERDEKNVTRDRVHKWEQDGDVEYLGTVTDIRPVMRETSVFVLPSYYREGKPRTSMEAVAMGRPLITTDSPGCRETVRPGETGFLVPPRDADGLVDAMRRFVEQPDLAVRMAPACRRYAERHYAVEQINQTILETMGL